jgi:hypothetical protein
MPSTKVLYTIIVVLLAAMLISSTFAAFYLFQYNRAENNADVYLSELRSSSASTQRTSIMLDFGNGTLLWYNDTLVESGTNAYVATVMVAHVSATWYPQYGEHFVTSIDNVTNSPQESWALWTHNGSLTWQVAQNGADLYQAIDGTVFAWTFCPLNASYTPECTP